jgi:hypothetical protein
MRTAGNHRAASSLFRLSGVSLLALSALTVSAVASDRVVAAASGTRCSAPGEGFVSPQGIDNCLRTGGHVRVESRVMQGNASLGAGLPGVADYGPAPAAMRSGSPTRQRMQVDPGGVSRR